MTCPHCSQTISRKQRANRVCGLCKREFAFEPKENALRLHDVRFRKVAEHVGAGGFKFTASQLGIALVRRPTSTTGSCALASILGLVGLVIIIFSVASSAPGAEKVAVFGGGLMVAGTFVFALSASQPPAAPTKETMWAETLPRWRAIYGELPRGLIDGDALAGLADDDRPLDRLLAAVVCPERDVLTSLLANGVPRDLRLGLLSTAPPADAWEEALLERLRKNSRLPILLLHDASAEGVFLARDLPRLLGLSAEHQVFDLGLNPRKSIAKKRTIIPRPVPGAILARLEHEAVGADVAGARPIRRGRAQVTTEELAWLKAGNCSPILAVPPASLVKRLKFTLAKFSPKRVPSQEEAELLKRLSPQRPTDVPAKAAAGFMSWPA